MGARGPAPKPDAVLRLAGSRHVARRNKAKRGESPCEIESLKSPPAWLKDRVALAEWRRLVKVLGAIDGWVTAADRTILAAHCQACADYARAVSASRGETDVLESPTGAKYLNPAVVAKSMALKALRETAAQLGLSPSDRTKVAVASAAATGRGAREQDEAAFTPRAAQGLAG